MRRLCRVCGERRSGEHFGGRGERRVVCHSCRKLPRQERVQLLMLDEFCGFLDQSNISAKNIRRLKTIEAEASTDVMALASLVRRIAEVRPH